MKLYNQIYGKYSPGTGSFLPDDIYEIGKKDFFHQKIIDIYEQIITVDLNRIGVFKDIKNYTILDVGTGRQALALHNLGAKSVDHYDISKTNCERFKKHLLKKKIPVRSFHADICDSNFNKKRKYDFIYLQGIIQHVKDPFMAISNLSSSLKKGGKIWFYNYQVGSINQLYHEVLREILKNKIKNSLLIRVLELTGFSYKEIDNAMDNYGCTYRHLLFNDDYKNHFTDNGLTRYFKKDIECQKNGLDLRVAYNSCIGGYIKDKEPKKKIKIKNLFHVDHFNPDFYISEQKDFIKELRNIKNEILQIQKTKNLSSYDLITICLPLLKGVTTLKNLKSFIDVKKELKRNLLISKFLSRNVI